ncbi:Translation machinery-associated protein 22 [Neolecta irregularis DAH-3]|uniref:Translation machinery-associated protein 22 n=1 Tax=Neolecta irregularis (strain DAH-3) TaxID=1198029 RepID=A0A1U7LRI5_NEOID|nr:Translation machinery-associated protein 22 [Neolecta irregularis DAH-3]|eukprot:OLL25193.1 Translation machinery-associated protein 22 [Neolecta irregularis DAH-3]
MSTLVPELSKAKIIVYCKICSFPPEYCEFGSTVQKCKDWLSASHIDIFNRLYSDEALASTTANLSIEEKLKIEKLQAKAAAKTEREEAKKASSKVYIKRQERSKRKHITAISGLETFGVDLKAIAKMLGKKFATGASVAKVAGGIGEEIVVQGDLSQEILEFIQSKIKEVPEDNIILLEEKAKKKTG